MVKSIEPKFWGKFPKKIEYLNFQVANAITTSLSFIAGTWNKTTSQIGFRGISVKWATWGGTYLLEIKLCLAQLAIDQNML